ncbi:hypothetical protein ACTXN4_07240 [Pseudomonas helleri]|uniref:hypothetical protein n=1 Tax=Pseudomonas helleri TaxID=1608996 RepID=UPI003FD5029B
MTDNNPPINDSNNVHVGNERVNKVHQYAIDVSTATRDHVARATFVRHLLEHYGTRARERWMDTLTMAPHQPAQALVIEKHALVTGVNIYIGIEHYKALKQLAIDISDDIRIQTTPTQVANHLIDHYSDVARANWVQVLEAVNSKD